MGSDNKPTRKVSLLLQCFAALVVLGIIGAVVPGALGGSSGPDAVPKVGIDAIVVLGGGLLPDGSPPPWQRARCFAAASLYRETTTGPAVVTLSGGTPWVL